ncbi:hypothetical protein BB560_003881 [Smittium megazygosporum]|uniref:Replication protein A C-terminal domain-containing protein n=1 Tax=Smittium megazygosporum TaxID=133381 RepID=A0A2T9Z8C2_9FUNG|nr:hypothetical protein BB560_004812 [Smittium megazygosporum]PVV01694.1 hypothetical protein BB560_003881 [Smittium megazygosporum]
MYNQPGQNQGYNYNAYGGHQQSMQGGMAYGAGDNYGSGSGGGFTASSQEDKKESFSQQTLRPASIKQLLEINTDNPEPPYTINGEEIKQVTVVAVVRDINVQTTMTQYTVEDGTGAIEVKMWIDQNSPAASELNVPLLSYVKITGDFRVYSDKKHILAHSIKPVTDHNELTYHGLDVIYASLYKDMKNSRSGEGSYSAHSAANTAAPQYKGNESDNIRRVYDYISNAPNSLEGVFINDIQKNIGITISLEQIRSAVNLLIDDGFVYTVMDEDHFFTTNAGYPSY